MRSRMLRKEKTAKNKINNKYAGFAFPGRVGKAFFNGVILCFIPVKKY